MASNDVEVEQAWNRFEADRGYALSPCRSTRDPKDEMSDLYIRMIPTDPEWQPTVEAAAGAVEYVAGLFAGPGDHVEAVEPVFYERITLIDGGQYMEGVSVSTPSARMVAPVLSTSSYANSRTFTASRLGLP
jgi:hypothetical protein